MVALFQTTFLYSREEVFPNPTATSADTYLLEGSPPLTPDRLALNLPGVSSPVSVTQMSPGAALFTFLYSNQFAGQMDPTPKLK